MYSPNDLELQDHVSLITYKKLLDKYDAGEHFRESKAALDLVNASCTSANTFVTDLSKLNADLVDMELYTIANAFKRVVSLKYVSDSGSMEEYSKTCTKPTKDIIQARKMILGVITRLVNITIQEEFDADF